MKHPPSIKKMKNLERKEKTREEGGCKEREEKMMNQPPFGKCQAKP